MVTARTTTAERTPVDLLEVRTEYALYRVAAAANDDEFYVWAASTEVVGDVITQRAKHKDKQFGFRGIKVMT